MRLGSVVLSCAALTAAALAADGQGLSCEPTLDQLIEQLDSEDNAVRGLAAWRLGQLGTEAAPAVPHLVPMLREYWGAGCYVTVYPDPSTSSPTAGVSCWNVFPPSEPTIKTASVSQVVHDALLKIGASAVDALIEEAAQENPFSRLYIAEMFRTLKDPRAFPTLINMLETEDGNLRVRAAQSLVALNDPDTVPALLSRLGHPSAWMRQAAVETLGLMKADVAAALAPLLKDPDSNVRKNTAEALAEIYQPESPSSAKVVELLLLSLRDPDWYVRRWTASALGSVVQPEISRALRKRLADKKEHMLVRVACARSLGRHGDRLAIPALLDLLNVDDTQGYSSRTDAAVALGDIAIAIQNDRPDDYKVIVDVLLTSMTAGDGYHRWQILQTMHDAFPPRAVPYIIPSLTDEHNNCREYAALALGELGSVASVPALLDALHDEDWVVQRNALDALGRIGDPRAIKPISEYLAMGGHGRCDETAEKVLATLKAENPQP